MGRGEAWSKATLPRSEVRYFVLTDNVDVKGSQGWDAPAGAGSDDQLSTYKLSTYISTGSRPCKECAAEADKHSKGDVPPCFVPSFFSMKDGIFLVSEPFSHMCPW